MNLSTKTTRGVLELLSPDMAEEKELLRSWITRHHDISAKTRLSISSAHAGTLAAWSADGLWHRDQSWSKIMENWKYLRGAGKGYDNQMFDGFECGLNGGRLCLFSLRSPVPNLAITNASTLKVPAFCKLVNSILITLMAVSSRHGASKLMYMSLGAVIAPIFKVSRRISSAATGPPAINSLALLPAKTLDGG